MKASQDRILTTHVGSLPRPVSVIELLLRKENGEDYDRLAFESTIKTGVADVVQSQKDIGLDLVSDGEIGKIGYSTYVKDRLTGFGGEYTPNQIAILPITLNFVSVWRSTWVRSRSRGFAAKARSR